MLVFYILLSCAKYWNWTSIQCPLASSREYGFKFEN